MLAGGRIQAPESLDPERGRYLFYLSLLSVGGRGALGETLRKQADSVITVRCKQGEYTMPADVWASYRRLYPSADDEFARMSIWLELNAAKRPAAPASAPRFVANWFKKVRAAQPARVQRELIVDLLTGRTHGNHRADNNVIDIEAAPARLVG